MFKRRSKIGLALSAMLASALLLTVAPGASAASASNPPPTKTLPGEGRWQPPGVHSQDSIAMAEDGVTDTAVAMRGLNNGQFQSKALTYKPK